MNGDGYPGNEGEDDDGDGLTDEDGNDLLPSDPNYDWSYASDDDENGYKDDCNGWNFKDDNNDPDDPYGHGTLCIGVAAASTDNTVGVAGVSWNSKIMPLRTWMGSMAAHRKAFIYAADNGADVLNCSWGLGGGSTLVVFGVKTARNEGRDGKGCIISAGAGNEGLSAGGYLTPLAKNDQVIAVAASENTDRRWVESSYGSKLDVIAPGRAIVTTEKGGGYVTNGVAGTSVACPNVAGLAALLLSRDSNLTGAEVQSLIQSSAEDEVGPSSDPTPHMVDSTGWDENYGWGRVNIYQGLQAADQGIDRFEVMPDGSDAGIAIDEFGFMYLSGSLKGTNVPTPNQTPIPTPNPNEAEFVIKDSSGNAVAIILQPEPAAGQTPTPKLDMYIAGEVYIRTTVPTPNPSDAEFIVRDGDGTPVALINDSGNLYLKGEYYNESNP